MANKRLNTIYLTLAVAILGIGSISGIVWYTRNQRQTEYDALIAAIDTGANENGDASDLQAKGNTLDKNYWKTVSNCTFDDEAANKKAMAVHDAGKATIARTDSNRQAVKSVLASFVNKCDASRVADVFFQRYKVDMYDYLKGFMNDAEMKTFVETPLMNLV